MCTFLHLRPALCIVVGASRLILFLWCNAVFLSPCFKSCPQNPMNEEHICLDWLAGKWRMLSIGWLTQTMKQVHFLSCDHNIIIILAACLRMEDIDSILVFLMNCLPVKISQSSGCMRCLHDMRRLHHLCQDRHPTCAHFKNSGQSTWL